MKSDLKKPGVEAKEMKASELLIEWYKVAMPSLVWDGVSGNLFFDALRIVMEGEAFIESMGEKKENDNYFNKIFFKGFRSMDDIEEEILATHADKDLKVESETPIIDKLTYELNSSCEPWFFKRNKEKLVRFFEIFELIKYKSSKNGSNSEIIG